MTLSSSEAAMSEAPQRREVVTARRRLPSPSRRGGNLSFHAVQCRQHCFDGLIRDLTITMPNGQLAAGDGSLQPLHIVFGPAHQSGIREIMDASFLIKCG
ncbi:MULTISPECIES: hypothetical protein [Stenotrophomonas]|uniref:hypothetical protein n=1 Tax=Stenotrophomonas TaxID=40323 RepID=UPI0015DFC4AE|nr:MULTISPECIES: hypothetical protein [Stenotrophomonas]MDH0274841.1 hypothetical protein [Stenotrophomonas sp. GD04089]MDH1913324.1 hypothetical protein [Stenotrophomonas sp. GD03794]HDS1173018.1 hypothetical protein [Stenotrophomonas maltophilia]